MAQNTKSNPAKPAVHGGYNSAAGAPNSARQLQQYNQHYPATNHNANHHHSPSSSNTTLHHHHHHHQRQNQVPTNHDQKVRLQAGDGEVITTTVGVARLSTLLRSMFEDVNGLPRFNSASQTNLDETVPLISISSECLKQIIEFCTKHEKDALAFLSDSERDEPAYIHAELPSWDQHFFVAMEQASLFEIILASSYLDIPLLTDYCCKFLAAMIRGKSAQQLRDMFNIRGDATPEEEKEVMKEFGFTPGVEANT